MSGMEIERKFLVRGDDYKRRASTFAQNGKSIYQKYSDADGVTAVYISPAMFRLIGTIPDLEVGDDKVNIGPLVEALTGFYILDSENPDINGKLRTEVERCKRKVEDDRAKLKVAEEKLKEAESSQILADVGALNLSPEQLAEFLKLVTSAKPGTDVYAGGNTKESYDNDPEEDEYDESEDTEDEEN